MSARVPHTRPGADYDAKPGRLAARLQRASHHGCRCALLGLPDDLGVQLNGGRPGAKTGPSQFRSALARFTGTGGAGVSSRFARASTSSPIVRSQPEKAVSVGSIDRWDPLGQE